MSKIKVLIVDDSELMRQLLSAIIGSTNDMEVVATAEDPLDAREKIKQFNPDVLTLDIEMPRMDGITFLRNLMRLRPMPVVMISTLTEKGAPATLEALEIGAVDFLVKPNGDDWASVSQYARVIQEKVRQAAAANVSHFNKLVQSKTKKIAKASYDYRKVIVIGSSTGGVEAIRQILQAMPENSPAILLAQHIPASFSASLAHRLDAKSTIKVQEAAEGMKIEPGHAYLANGDFHLEVAQKGDAYFTRLNSAEKVNRHRPSVDVLFDSAVRHVGKHTVGVILTGMGSDGANGLKSIFDVGGSTFAQDEETSVVWGMPSAAIRLNAVQQVLPIEKIPKAILKACEIHS
ncbi:MAG: protein-glutamate methylesterase/protein-glutamine glutaminase [Oleiphilus sp.]